MNLHWVFSRLQSLHARSIVIYAILPWIFLCNLYPQYSETIYDGEDGLTHNSVLDIANDENGFIWVFTTSGVCRFDGHHFKEYKADVNGFRRTIPYDGRLMTDSHGRIWIESSLPALLVYDNDLDKVNIAHEIKYHDFYDIADDGFGNYFITGFSQMHQVELIQRDVQMSISQLTVQWVLKNLIFLG